ncbi:MAG: Alanine--tRNA ligase [Chlamydiae bacterium]|nr:Alanine--tRNA ligase [Chlamydiota bacterium]
MLLGMQLDEIRAEFLRYFTSKGHTLLPSGSVVPHADPTLLFNNAGMNQFKDIFLGLETPQFDLATTTQKCIRVGGKHNDLENVGHTTRHLTFFEMLGNFSFDAYFKKEAIDFAFELACNIFHIDTEHLWASVFEEDEESFELWKKYLPEKRIVRLGKKDNFWSMGNVGPCGPCSELLFDRGKKISKATTPKDDVEGERFFEFWNLVFMQYNQTQEGIIEELPRPMVDTGMGLERMAALLQNKTSVFEIDFFQELIRHIEALGNTKYNAKSASAFHVIADHLRTLCFAISDGATPSNTERGYVLRKILRRAVRYGKQIGFEAPFLHKLVGHLVDLMPYFKELKSAQNNIETLLLQEEENFFATLKRGGNLLQKMLLRSKGTLSGDDCFKLKDTYGFPLEEIELIAKDQNLTLEKERFFELEKKAKELSKSAANTTTQVFSTNYYSEHLDRHGTTQFEGYHTLELNSVIQAILVEDEPQEKILTEQKGLLILQTTPFYAEMGGQVGDTGVIETPNARFVVEDTQIINHIIVHIGRVEKGQFSIQETVTANVDAKRRKKIQKNHTATHLLHHALCHVLGEHVKQAGSFVGPNYLRFDFSHNKALSKKELLAIENMINEKILTNASVQTHTKNYDAIKNDSSIKQFFGEKYSKTVRVVDVDFSKELCGGTHVKALGEIGLFKIIKEASIAQGQRRIEAISAMDAILYTHEQDALIDAFSEKLKSPKLQLLEKVDALQIEKKELEQTIKKLEKNALESLAEQLLQQGSHIFTLVDIEKKQLLPLCDLLFAKSKSLALGLFVQSGENVHILIKVSKDLIEKEISAKDLLQKVFDIAPGKGGGNAQMAQGMIETKDVGNIIETLKQHVLKLC